jgi:hypothetical protein
MTASPLERRPAALTSIPTVGMRRPCLEDKLFCRTTSSSHARSLNMRRAAYVEGHRGCGAAPRQKTSELAYDPSPWWRST